MKPANATPGMRRTEIRAVMNLPKHKGCKARLAETLGVSPTAITLWLAGKMTSARIAAAAEALAIELVGAEKPGVAA